MAQNIPQNAVLAGSVGALIQSRSVSSPNAADYAQVANAANAIAVEVANLSAQLTPAVTSADQARLLSNIAFGVLSERSASSINPTDYAQVAGTIIALYNAAAPKLTA